MGSAASALVGRYDGPGTVVHLAGRMTDQVHGFLGPATEALSASGVKQVVVLVDAPEFRHLLPRFDASVDLVPLPHERVAWRRWGGLARLFFNTLGRPGVRAVHLHGFMPLVIGTLALLCRGKRRIAVYYSPHGSKSLGALRALTQPALWATRAALLPASERAIASVPMEANALTGLAGFSAAVIEMPVDPGFFHATHREAPVPLVLTSGRIETPRIAEIVVQMAVLMGGEDLKIHFEWVGPVDVVSAARLKAAGVGVWPVTNAEERAQRLSSAWVYVAHGRSRGFPLHLAEAMAAGLPCVAIDSPVHRGLLRHGETGFLCADAESVWRHVARLVDDPELRARMGRAARREAEQRFAHARFCEALLEAYEVERRVSA